MPGTEIPSCRLRLSGAKPCQQTLHIGGKGGLDLHLGAGPWMTEAKQPSVQGLTAEQRRRPAVQAVSKQRVADMAHMNANLMRPSGVERKPNESRRAPGFQNLVERDRPVSARRYSSPRRMMPVLADRLVDLALRRIRHAVYGSPILAADCLLPTRSCER